MATEQWKQEHVEEMRAYRRKRYHENRQQYYDRVEAREKAAKEFIAKLKAKLKCSRCPENDPRCLDFHHLDQSKKIVNIARAHKLGWSSEKILEEMAKCIVLCSNCHRKEHLSL